MKKRRKEGGMRGERKKYMEIRAAAELWAITEPGKLSLFNVFH